MLARESDAASRARPWAGWRFLLVLAGVIAISCDKVPLTAPTESTIQLFVNGSSVPVDGSVEVTAVVVEQAGTPVQNGTVVGFTTSLGTIEPSEARTQNGKATARLRGDGRSGTAVVTAFSGGATSEPVEVPIGAAAAAAVIVRAEPGSVPAGGGTVKIIAQVQDEFGNPLNGVPVSFSASAGQLSPGTAKTNANGEAQTSLTTAAETTVTASAGGQSGEVIVGVGTVPSVTLSASPTTPAAGTAVTFTIGVSSDPGASPIQNVRLSFGDGESVNLGAVSGQTTASHVYDDPGAYTVTATVTDVSGGRVSQSLVIVVTEAAPIAGRLQHGPAVVAVVLAAARRSAG